MVAFKFPNMLRELVGEGASNAAFVPVFAEARTKKDEEEFKTLVSAVMSAMILVLGVLTLVGILAMPAILNSLSMLDSVTGKDPVSPERIEQLLVISQWTFPYLFFICLAVFFMAPLFTIKHYATPSWSPALLNIAFIACALLLRDSFDDPAYALVAGAWIGGIAQLLVQYFALARLTGIRFPNFKLGHPGIRRVFFLVIPVLIGQSAGEVNRLVDTLFAASLPDTATVTWLYFSNRLIQLPLSIFAVATSVAILPALSEMHANSDFERVNATIRQGLSQSFFFVLPTIAGLMILGEPIIALLFERGEFTSADTQSTAVALRYYAAGLLAFAWVKVVVTGFYSAKDTLTPVLIASAAMVFNVALNFALVGPLGFRGLAVSTTISYSLNAIALVLVLNSRNEGLLNRDWVIRIGRMIGATFFMAVVTWGTLLLAKSWFPDTTLLHRSGLVLVPLTASLVAYGVLAKGFQVREFDHFLEGLRRRTER